MAKRKYSEVEMIGALKQLEAGRTRQRKLVLPSPRRMPCKSILPPPRSLHNPALPSDHNPPWRYATTEPSHTSEVAATCAPAHLGQLPHLSCAAR
jgi:hypothetical protein